MQDFDETAHALLRVWNGLRDGRRLPELCAARDASFAPPHGGLAVDALTMREGRPIVVAGRDTDPKGCLIQPQGVLSEDLALTAYLQAERIGLPVLRIDEPEAWPDAPRAEVVMPMAGAPDGARMAFMVWASHPAHRLEPPAPPQAPRLRVLDPRRSRNKAA